MLKNVFIAALMMTAIHSAVFAATPKVSQRIFDIGSMGLFDPQTGRPVGDVLANLTQAEALANSRSILDVTYFSLDNTQLRLQVDDAPTTVYLKFLSEDSARLVFDLLVSGNVKLILIYNHRDFFVGIQTRWIDVPGNSLSLWNNETKTVTRLGNVIGPMRKVENLRWDDALVVRIFGKWLLNDINFVGDETSAPAVSEL